MSSLSGFSSHSTSTLTSYAAEGNSLEITLAMNQGYQDVIDGLFGIIRVALDRVQHKQQEVIREIEQHDKRFTIHGSHIKVPKNFLPANMWIPHYFQDRSGMLPPLSSEALRVYDDLKIHNPLVRIPIPWRPKEEKTLTSSVITQRRRAQLERVTERMRSVDMDLQRKMDLGIEDKQCLADQLATLHHRNSHLRTLTTAHWLRDIAADRCGPVEFMEIAAKLDHRTAVEAQQKWSHELSPNINSTTWSQAEIDQLQELTVKTLSTEQLEANGPYMFDWDAIVDKLGTHRDPFDAFCQFWQYVRQIRRNMVKWTPELSEKLLNVVECCKEGPHIDWNQVAYYMDDLLEPYDLEQQYRSKLDPEIHRGLWSIEEDAQLAKAVADVGPDKWAAVARRLPSRTASQCRSRWLRSLDPSIRFGAWIEEEDCRLREAVAMFGSDDWINVSNLIPGRVASRCRERWKALQIRDRFQNTVLSMPSGLSRQERWKILRNIPVGPGTNSWRRRHGAPVRSEDGTICRPLGRYQSYKACTTEMTAKRLEKRFKIANMRRHEAMRRAGLLTTDHAHERLLSIAKYSTARAEERLAKLPPVLAKKIARKWRLVKEQCHAFDVLRDSTDSSSELTMHTRVEHMRLESQIRGLLRQDTLFRKSEDQGFQSLRELFLLNLRHPKHGKPAPPNFSSLSAFRHIIDSAARLKFRAMTIMPSSSQHAALLNDSDDDGTPLDFAGYGSQERSDPHLADIFGRTRILNSSLRRSLYDILASPEWKLFRARFRLTFTWPALMIDRTRLQMATTGPRLHSCDNVDTAPVPQPKELPSSGWDIFYVETA